MKININPDKEFVNDMRKALKDNNGFCPCSLKKNEDTKCMCKEFREMAKWNLPLRSLHKNGIKERINYDDNHEQTDNHLRDYKRVR